VALLRTSRQAWIDAGLRALAAGGPDAVRVELLAQELGVTKGGFYGQFGDRRALLDAMLDSWEQAVVDAVVERVETEGGDARARLRRLFALRASDPPFGGELLAIELAIRDWARRDEAVAARLRRVDERRMDYLRSLFGAFCPDPADVEARCLLVMTLYVGLHFVAVDHGEHRRTDVVERCLRLLES
jgi:AcrR family transcriptional regulator